jgi:hypothetical protein
MAMKVKAEIVGYGPHPGKTEALVRVSVELDGRRETMEITVLVPAKTARARCASELLRGREILPGNLPTCTGAGMTTR